MSHGVVQHLIRALFYLAPLARIDTRARADTRNERAADDVIAVRSRTSLFEGEVDGEA